MVVVMVRRLLPSSSRPGMRAVAATKSTAPTASGSTTNTTSCTVPRNWRIISLKSPNPGATCCWPPTATVPVRAIANPAAPADTPRLAALASTVLRADSAPPPAERPTSTTRARAASTGNSRCRRRRRREEESRVEVIATEAVRWPDRRTTRTWTRCSRTERAVTAAGARTRRRRRTIIGTRNVAGSRTISTTLSFTEWPRPTRWRFCPTRKLLHQSGAWSVTTSPKIRTVTNRWTPPRTTTFYSILVSSPRRTVATAA
uniref:(northern house mosquito) hypothetical protein n=2 Tax=Culex pipiens TaxID=7175 RepID=A0A8D8AD76_CULPI